MAEETHHQKLSTKLRTWQHLGSQSAGQPGSHPTGCARLPAGAAMAQQRQQQQQPAPGSAPPAQAPAAGQLPAPGGPAKRPAAPPAQGPVLRSQPSGHQSAAAARPDAAGSASSVPPGAPPAGAGLQLRPVPSPPPVRPGVAHPVRPGMLRLRTGPLELCGSLQDRLVQAHRQLGLDVVCGVSPLSCMAELQTATPANALSRAGATQPPGGATSDAPAARGAPPCRPSHGSSCCCSSSVWPEAWVPAASSRWVCARRTFRHGDSSGRSQPHLSRAGAHSAQPNSCNAACKS